MNMKNLILAAVLCLLPITTLSIAAQSDEIVADSALAASGMPVFAENRPIAPVVKHVTVKQITDQNVMYIRGTEGSVAFTLAGHGDNLITRAILHLHYTFSPALIPVESHLKVWVNDELINV